ncbi:MAG TPA: hypothetical protein ENG33_05430, partial [Chloroflexi bacterium]|nr:hypothetical protein [Chloroflexota bacterium]
MRIKAFLLTLPLVAGLTSLIAWGGPSLTAGTYESLAIATEDGLSLTLSSDGLVLALAVDGEELVGEPAPALWVRDMSQAGEVTEPNLLANPGFEEGDTGWSPLALNQNITIALASDAVHGGDWALKFTGPADAIGFGGWGSDPISV